MADCIAGKKAQFLVISHRKRTCRQHGPALHSLTLSVVVRRVAGSRKCSTLATCVDNTRGSALPCARSGLPGRAGPPAGENHNRSLIHQRCHCMTKSAMQWWRAQQATLHMRTINPHQMYLQIGTTSPYHTVSTYCNRAHSLKP